MSIIKIENLKKKFGDFTALDGISMNIEKGEVYGFIGPNGAGKTTTTRVMLGMYRATDGKAEIFGKDCWEDSVEIHKNIAFVPGDVNLWPGLTGGEVIDFLMHLNGANDRKRREEYIKRFDLDVSKKCKKYSKGNRQKVALVSAFSLDADLYILDEPTSGLDPLMEKTFQECVAEEKAKGKTILLSSHILSEVESLCDRISIIRKGKIIETGSLDSMRHLTRNNIRLVSDIPKERFNGITGVYDLKFENGVYNFQIDASETNNILKLLNGYEIKNIEITPLSLEELFMHFYNEEQ
ncbi:MAG: ABC transporter ATP-binding protein [Ruminococcus sp.]|nr:ABC transporter ATP-binding protein [Ruminococcus sp.]HRR76162.1 ABC transporter ATP-binding protein [Ruminococcus sp.]